MQLASLFHRSRSLIPTLLCGVTLALPWLLPAPAQGGAYLFAGDTWGLDVITHPKGYTGTGGPLSVSVCIDPASPNATEMVTPVENAIATVNALVPTTGNLSLGAFNDIPSGYLDFESVVLHEIGHCIGLAHANLATESGLTGSDLNYTKSTKGADTSYDLDSGTDTVRGSSDDVRGDDVNLHWFAIANNNPFTSPAIVDSTTYARDLSSLPSGDLFAANGDRSVAALLGFADTEAVMQQGQFTDEAQRDLGADDVATLRYAMSGLDEIAGSSDDYTLTLTYAGLSNSCDLVLSFDNSETSFAVCKVSASSIPPTSHWRIVTANAYFNTGFNWHFTTPTPGPSPTPTPGPSASPSPTPNPSSTPSPTPSAPPSPTPSPTASPTPSPTPLASGSAIFVEESGICGGRLPCYTTLPTALSAAADGDSILVATATYDAPSTVDKTLPFQIRIEANWNDSFTTRTTGPLKITSGTASGTVLRNATIRSGRLRLDMETSTLPAAPTPSPTATPAPTDSSTPTPTAGP